MKFENPKMNISMFEVENVVTGSNDPTVGPTTTAEQAAENSGLYVAGKTITVTF